MALPIKKIYIDTKYKSADSISNSNFKIDLPHSLTFPENSVFYIDDVSIPHSWYVVEGDVNDKLYITVIADDGSLNAVYTVTIQPGNYNGIDLASELAIRINNVVVIPTLTDVFATSYSVKRNAISIYLQYSGYKFKIFSPEELKTQAIHDRYSNVYDVNNPQDMNEIIGDVEGYYAFPFGYESESLNLQTIRNIYIHSSLGNYNTIGPRGESSIIKKIPVNANKGEYIFDQVLTSNDFGDCSKQTLRTIKFDLKDSRGNYIQSHGSNLSFSIIFSRMDATL
jgi:hypothetical protein